MVERGDEEVALLADSTNGGRDSRGSAVHGVTALARSLATGSRH